MNMERSSTANKEQTSASDEVYQTLSFTDKTEMLRYLYADVTRLTELASPDVVLHPFDRASASSPASLVGISACQAHEEALVAATGGTLLMDVESVIANAHFGTVLGTLRASASFKNNDAAACIEDLAVPFCGVWRFDAEGRLREHWENVDADLKAMKDWFSRVNQQTGNEEK